MSLSIHCGFRYGPYANSLGANLTKVFGSKVKISYQKDPGATGNFEVTLQSTKELIHSKKSQGKGRCESPDEVQAIVDKIMTYLTKA